MFKIRKHIKPVFVIEQKGQDFTWTAKTPSSTHVNSFSLGKESEVTYIDGKKMKVFVASCITMCDNCM